MATPAPKINNVPGSVPVPEILPSANTLLQAARIAIKEDCPIQLDYFADSLAGKAFIGEDEVSKDKVLVKAADEYTSEITKVYKASETEFIVMTVNSLYIVSTKIPKRRIPSNFLQ
jgi:hypothetical protein